jgi:hypothetical protein
MNMEISNYVHGGFRVFVNGKITFMKPEFKSEHQSEDSIHTEYFDLDMSDEIKFMDNFKKCIQKYFDTLVETKYLRNL